MSLKEAYKPYTDPLGFIHPGYPENHTPSQNALRWTSEAYILMFRQDELTESDIQTYAQLVRICYKEKGLLNRYPSNNEQEGPDDYHAVLAACKILNLPDLAKEILDYGRANYFNYNNQTPGKFTGSAFLGRQLGLVAGMYLASNQEPNFFLKLAFKIALQISARTSVVKNQDIKTLAYFLILTAKDYKPLEDSIKSWYDSLYKEVPNGMQGVLSIYYNNGNYPTVKYWKD